MQKRKIKKKLTTERVKGTCLLPQNWLHNEIKVKIVLFNQNLCYPWPGQVPGLPGQAPGLPGQVPGQVPGDMGHMGHLNIASLAGAGATAGGKKRQRDANEEMLLV